MPTRKAVIQLKRVYESPAPEDGTRILVDRLWPRGITKAQAQLDAWLKEVAPSAALRKWFDHDPRKWDEFGSRYRIELEKNTQAVQEIQGFLKSGRVTLVYAAHDTEHTHAIVLAAFLRRT
jgi:uncharacterized protein YeaO (DUF488 family)